MKERFHEMKRIAIGLGLVCLAAGAADMRMTWTLLDGKTETETRPLAEKDGVLSFRVAQGEIRAKGAKRLEMTPDFATARKGDAGYWVVPTGQYGTYRCDKGDYSCSWPSMSMFGMKTPAKTWVAFVTGLKYYFTAKVSARDGVYRMSCVLNAEQCADPYEDFSIEYHFLSGADADYSGMARAYRKYQLDRKAIVPFTERVKDNPLLKYGVEAPEIRIRQAWKPVPSPKPNQTPEDEPQVKQVVTFDRVQDIVRELKKQGVGKAELCLVGWNVGGHDGRWPQIFPVEPSLGGEARLRELIKMTQANGYQIVPHGNWRDAYLIADCWDAEWTVKNADGTIKPAHTQWWGGGCPYEICPQRAYEKFCTRDLWRIRALGFQGMGYFDTVTILLAPKCDDPRHKCSRADSAKWWGRCAALTRKAFGGFASEGSLDHFAGETDSVLYASFGDPRKKNKGLVDGMIPVWQIVYNGFIVQNPFTTTVNFTAQDRYSRLKLLEYGGRPNFYFYSKFVSDGTDWMGDSDLRCGTDKELQDSVAKIKEGWDIYAKLNYLQYLFMEKHERLAEDVFCTTWSDGSRLVTNYGAKPFAFEGKTVAAKDWLLVKP